MLTLLLSSLAVVFPLDAHRVVVVVGASMSRTPEDGRDVVGALRVRHISVLARAIDGGRGGRGSVRECRVLHCVVVVVDGRRELSNVHLRLLIVLTLLRVQVVC